MAISKDISIHNAKGIKNCIAYVTDKEKTIMEKCGYDISKMSKEEIASFRNVNGDVMDLFDYARNKEKTSFVLDGDEEVLVSGYRCNPDTASIEFQMTRDKYYRYLERNGIRSYGIKVDKETGEINEKEAIDAYHIIMSFPDIEGLDPRLIHQLGLEFCDRAFSNHKCIVTTHMNTNHLHNHIIICAYNEDSFGKHCMTKDARREYRRINDEISLEYGLPILLDNDITNSRKSLTWYEWEQHRNGKSWKDQIRSDIDLIKSMSSSWDDFKRKMESGGYTLRETEKYVTYTMPGSEAYKCRDKNLGKGYLKKDILKSILPEQEYNEWLSSQHVPEKEKNKKPIVRDVDVYGDKITKKTNFQKIYLNVSRYSSTGKRRSDLEMLLLKAIKIVRYFMDRFWDEVMAEKQPTNPIYMKATTKLRALEQSLLLCKESGITSNEELNNKLTLTGSKIAQDKKELSDLQENIEFEQDIIEKIKAVKSLEKEVNRLQYPKEKLFLNSFTEKEIALNRANAMPMSSKQRQELFLKLQDNQEWKLKYKFDSLTYTDAKQALDFLEGKGSKPSFVITDEEYRTYRLDSKYENIRLKMDKNLKDKYGNRNIISSYEKQIEVLKEKHPELQNIDTKSLSLYQGIKIINYYSSTPFHSPLANAEDKKRIAALLKEKGIKPIRKIDYLLSGEVKVIERYLKTQTGAIPDFLKETTPISDSTKTQLRELMLLKGVTCSIPLDELTQADAQNYSYYLINKDVKPDILCERTDLPTKQDLFVNEIKDFSFDDKKHIIQYRELINNLRSYGIDENDIELFEAQHSINQEYYNELKHALEDSMLEYKNLSRLKYVVNLAENRSFTRGPLYQKSEIEMVNEEVTNNSTISKEDDLLEKQTIEKSMDDIKTQKRDYYRNISDDFFDRL